MISIVPVQEKYAGTYRACLDVVAREKKYLAQIEALPLERVQEFVKHNVASDAIQFFAIDQEEVVGWADVFPAWAHALSHSGSLGMGIHPNYRRRGLGGRLLSACIEKAWSKGLTRIELEARVDNAAAIALYEKVGFKHEALKRNALRFDGVYYDAVQMRLLREED
jgi:RimJ/RimL family protein N-acetyltransferase